MNEIINKPLLEDIKILLQVSRQHLQQTVNTTILAVSECQIEYTEL